MKLLSEALNKDEHGGKATGISELIRAGLPAPNGFVIPTHETFNRDFENGDKHPMNGYMYHQLMSRVRYIANDTNTYFSDEVLLDRAPLLVSVRSGAPVSMPGMMDTILNIGLTRNNLDQFVESKNATRSFGLDCYRRLVQMFAVTVHGVSDELFTQVYNAAKTYFFELNEEAYEIMANMFEQIYLEEVGEPFPQRPSVQLLGAVNAVFMSYYSEKAKQYRSIEGLSDSMGTAVTVQPMIFGNLDRSATGVAFTHNPNTGVRGLYGEYLRSAQGEDVVAGTHAVLSLDRIFKDPELQHPAADLSHHMGSLLSQKKDILDVEFTIERGQLWILQYRVAKRSNRASVRSILDMTRQGDISSEEATVRFMKMLPEQDTGITTEGDMKLLGQGLGVTEGIVTGKIATTHEFAEECHNNGEPFIYVANETNPNDVVQMKNSVGILTATGGSLSHAAVVARGWGKSCVVSFEEITVIDNGIYHGSGGGIHYPNGTIIRINGDTGEVYV